MTRRLHVLGLVLCLTAGANGQHIFYVNEATGNDAWTGLCPDWDGGTCGPKKTIQAAINAAGNEDTIIVLPGAYLENIAFLGKAVTLTGTNPQDPSVVASTIIDGGGNASTVTFQGSEKSSTVLTGFTVTGGDAWFGGGVRGNHAEPTISWCVITGNGANDDGGGLAHCDGPIHHCTVVGNVATDGAGLADCDGPISYCTIGTINAPNITSGFGGGLAWCDGPLNHCTVVGNAADSGGGLADCDGDIRDCTIMDNTSNTNGGGLSGCAGSIDGCTISGNLAGWNGGGLADCSGSIRGCAITGNLTSGGGGGLYSCPGTVSVCVISGNAAWNGGGLGSCHGTITRCRITANNAGFAGGGASACSAEVRSCLIAGNTADYGAGLDNCDLDIDGCTVTENWARNDGGGLRDCNWIISNCILWANVKGNPQTPSQLLNCSPPTYSDIAGGGGGAGCIDADPLFVASGYWDGFVWVEGDYHLTAASPCIDTGDPAYVPDVGELDIDGELRVWDGNGDGQPRVDMGADEYGSSHAGDLNCDGSIDFGDINPFVLYQSNFPAWQFTFPGCPPQTGDINGDGTYGQGSFGDINPFVALLSGGR
jgi:hypothetical protein